MKRAEYSQTRGRSYLACLLFLALNGTLGASFGISTIAVAEETDPDAEEEGKSVEEKEVKDGDDAESNEEQSATEEAKVSELVEPDQGARVDCSTENVDWRLLTRLRERRVELDRREQRILRQKDDLDRLEQKLNKRIAVAVEHLERLEHRLGLGVAQEEIREKKLEALAAALTSLSARKAAPMLEKTDPNLAARLLVLLGPERSGALLSKMDPQRAATLMERIAQAKTTAQRAAARAYRGGSVARSKGKRRSNRGISR